MHLSKTLILCAQRKQPCTRYFSSFQENFDLPRVCYQPCLCQKNWEGILAWKKPGLRHWEGFETLALGCRWWKHQCDTWIVVICSLSSNLQKHTWMLHPRVTLLLDTEFLICFLVAFMDILRLFRVSVKCSIRCLLFMEHFCSRCWFTLSSNLSEKNGDHSIFLSRKAKIFLLWFFGFWSSLSRELVRNCTLKFLTALPNPAVDTHAHFLICHEQAVMLWTQEYEFLYSQACECFCLHVFDHSQHETEIV